MNRGAWWATVHGVTILIMIYTLSCVKQIASEKMLYNTGSPAWSSVMTCGVGWGEGKEAQEGGDRYFIMTHVCYCMADTNTTL